MDVFTCACSRRIWRHKQWIHSEMVGRVELLVMYSLYLNFSPAYTQGFRFACGRQLLRYFLFILPQHFPVVLSLLCCWKPGGFFLPALSFFFSFLSITITIILRFWYVDFNIEKSWRMTRELWTFLKCHEILIKNW